MALASSSARAEIRGPTEKSLSPPVSVICLRTYFSWFSYLCRAAANPHLAVMLLTSTGQSGFGFGLQGENRQIHRSCFLSIYRAWRWTVDPMIILSRCEADKSRCVFVYHAQGLQSACKEIPIAPVLHYTIAESCHDCAVIAFSCPLLCRR